MIDAFDALKISTSRLNAIRMQQQAKTAAVAAPQSVLQNPLLRLRATSPAADTFIKSAPKPMEPVAVKPTPLNKPLDFFRTLKERMMPPTTPARVNNPAMPLRSPAVPPAAFSKMQDLRLPPPRRQGENPFGNIKLSPQPDASGLSALALPLMSVGMLAAPVAAPAALVAKPAMMNQMVGAISAWFA